MNRSLTNVLFGGISAPVNAEAHKIEGTITKTTVDDTADALANAENVILVHRYDVCNFAPLTIFMIAGRWLRHGCGEGAVRNIGDNCNAPGKGH